MEGESKPSLSPPPQRTLTSLVCLLKSRPHPSQSAVEFLLGQLQTSYDEARALVCHALAAIASHLPVLGDGMLGALVDLYRVACNSSTDMQQELLVRGPRPLTQPGCEGHVGLLWQDGFR